MGGTKEWSRGWPNNRGCGVGWLFCLGHRGFGFPMLEFPSFVTQIRSYGLCECGRTGDVVHWLNLEHAHGILRKGSGFRFNEED